MSKPDTTNRQADVLALVKENPMVSQQTIAVRLGISRSAVAGHIMMLTQKGIIEGRGYVLSSQPYVAVVGGANMDIHGYSDQPLVYQDSNPGTVATCAGGVARNIAESLARLGTDTKLISAVGRDDYGQLLLKDCAAAGIDTTGVLEHPTLATSTYVSIANEQGDMQLAVADMAVTDSLTPDYLASTQAMLRLAAVTIVDCNLSPSALAYLFNNFSERPLFVDTVSTQKAMRVKPYLAHVHTLKPSLLEAQAIAGQAVDNVTQLPQLADWFHHQGVQRLFISLGSDGLFYSDTHQQGLHPAVAHTNQLNTSGAGDTLLAGLAYAWLQNWPLMRSLGFAQAAAAATIEHTTTNHQSLSLAQVEQMYQEHYA